MLKCLIVEDQPPAQRILKAYIEDFEGLNLAAAFADPLAALSFRSEHKIDILYLDIHLPKISGLHLLKMMTTPPKVILTTAFADYALESYELDVVDYLLKPFSFERFAQATQKAIDRIGGSSQQVEALTKSDTPEKLFVKSGTEYLQLSLSSIRYISAEGDYTMVHTDDGRHLVAYSLRYWMDQLPEKRFCQVDKSYIVQIDRISKVVSNFIEIEDHQIPIGRTYKESFTKNFLN